MCRWCFGGKIRGSRFEVVLGDCFVYVLFIDLLNYLFCFDV